MSNFSSYPPLFRPSQGVDEWDPRSDWDPEGGCLPVIDLEAVESGRVSLSSICREWGMFRLTNHGVSPELLTQLHDHASKLFSRSFQSKEAIPTTPMLYFWGNPALTMSCNAHHKTPPAHAHNWLEGLNLPLAKISNSNYQDPLLESFRRLLEEYGAHQTRLAKVIFGAMAQDLNLPPPKSASYLDPDTGIIRVYRYLRCPAADQRWGIHEHTDSSVLSIIHQDQVGGLQVYKNSQWLDVDPIHDTLIVNLGDMMQAMSDDKYVSVTHRVRVNRVKERVSIGYFVFPAEDGVIDSSKYEPFTYADFQAQNELDLKTVGNKIGLPRFKKENSPSQVSCFSDI